MSSSGRAWSISSPRAEVEVAREDLVATVTARLTLNPEVDWTRHVHCTVTKYMKWSEEKESIAQNDSAIFQQVCFVPPSSRKLGLRQIGPLVSTPQLMKCNSLKMSRYLLHSIAVSLFGWSKQIQFKSSPNRESEGKIQIPILRWGPCLPMWAIPFSQLAFRASW